MTSAKPTVVMFKGATQRKRIKNFETVQSLRTQERNIRRQISNFTRAFIYLEAKYCPLLRKLLYK